MARLRLLLLGLSLFVLVWLNEWAPMQVLGQPGPPGTIAPEAGQGGLSLADWALVRNLKDAEKRLNDGEASEAARRIQQLLAQPQDGFFRPTGEKAGTYLSLKRRAAVLLQNATPAVRESYELQFGVEAREKFERAQSQHDAKLVQEVTQQYPFTAAGGDAHYWLASNCIDQGDYFSAIQHLNRLKSLPSSVRFEPRLSLRLALCWSRLGTPEKALSLIQTALRQTPQPIQIGNLSLQSEASTEQVLAWLKSLSRGMEEKSAVSSTGWQLPRGTPDRNPQLQSSPPAARTLWNVAMNSWQQLNRRTLKPETIDVTPQVVACGIVHQDAAVTPFPSTIPLIVDDLVLTRYPDHIAAIDLRTGKEVWSTLERDRTFYQIRASLNSTDKITSPFTNLTLDFRDAFKILLRQRLWEDLTYGTLSSDGELVFAIEDLGLITPSDMEIKNGKPHPIAMKDYNRLCAFDVKSGMLRWELGGPNSAIKLEQGGAFFLGPPLPVGQQLYCLAENQGYVQLLALDGKTGRQLWIQNLTQLSEELRHAPNRRRAGLSPALIGDLLVCPTGMKYVVAVDTGTRSLAWAYQYSNANPDPNQGNPRFFARGIRLRNGTDPDLNPERPALTNEWQDGSPILTDSHVILTPRDLNELHCVSLEDGAFQWRIPRGEGQYVAAVHDGLVLVVHKHSVEALHLADGRPAWPAPIPVLNQTGRGITTKSHLVLPLVNGQVVSIEIKTGRKFYSRVRSTEQEPLGNLVSGPGFVLSVTPNEMCAFRTLEAVYPEAVAKLKANPQDAEALAQRGEYRLSTSQIEEGQADLRASLRLQKLPDAEFLLFESLLEGLQSDFAMHRNVATELEQLAHTPNQKSALYRTWATGLRKQGEFRAAFEMLDKLNRRELGRPDIERVDGNLAIRRDRWIRNEVAQVMASASQADRDFFQSALRAHLEAAKSGSNDDDLRQFIRFLSAGALADEARLALAERLSAKEYSLEAEQLLFGLRKNPVPAISGHAVAMIVEGMVKLQRSDEALKLIEELETLYGEIVCHQGKTGRQLATEWRRGLTVGSDPYEQWPTGRVQIQTESLEKNDKRANIEIPVDLDPGPFYSDIQLKIEASALRFLGMTGLGITRFAMPLNELLPLSNSSTLHAQVRNHLILLNTGLHVVAVNTLTDGKTIRAQRIWSTPLVDGPVSDEGQFIPFIRPRAGLGRPRFLLTDRLRNNIGMVGAIQDDSLCVIRGRHLVLIDILTGETIWKRANMIPGSEIFGDQEYIFVIPPVPLSPTPQPAVARKIRRADGMELGDVSIPPPLNRLQTFGSRILSTSNHPQFPATKFLLKLEDMAQGQPVWEHAFPQGTQISVIGETEIAVLEPSGLATLLRTDTGKSEWTQQLPPLTNRREFTVIADGPRLLFLRDEIPPQNFPPQPIIAVNGMQTVMYGPATCVERSSGKILWTRRVDNFAMDFSMPGASPIWFFTARALTQQGQVTEVRMLALDKRTGQIAMQASERSYVHDFEFLIDPKEKQIEVLLIGGPQPVRHRLKFTDLPAADPVVPVPEKPGEKTSPKQSEE